MTKRNAAILGVRCIALYLLVWALISLVRAPFLTHSLLNYSHTLDSIHVKAWLLVTSAILPPAVKFMIAVLFWFWSSRIGARVFPDSESGADMAALNMHGWLSSSVFAWGIWVFLEAMWVCVGIAILLSKQFVIDPTASASSSTILDMWRDVISGITQLVAGLIIALTARRIAALVCRKKDESIIINPDAVILGIRLAVLYAGASTLSAIPYLFSPDFVNLAMNNANHHLELQPWYYYLLGVTPHAVLLIFAVLTWRFAASISKLINRGIQRQDQDEPQTIPSA